MKQFSIFTLYLLKELN